MMSLKPISLPKVIYSMPDMVPLFCCHVKTIIKPGMSLIDVRRYICIIFAAVLCFSAYVYEDSMNGDKYSAFMSLTSFSKDFMLGDTSFCSFEVMRKVSGSWLSLFIPPISAFAFIPLVCDEYEAKSVRLEIFRSSKLCYNLSKFITACLCGGFAVMLGFGLFILADYALFPNINEYSNELKKTYEEMLSYIYPNVTQSGYSFIIIKNGRNVFVRGGLCSSCDHVYKFYQKQISRAVHTVFHKVYYRSNLHKAAIAGKFRLY